MFAVQGIYADGIVTIKEPVPVDKQYEVVVTFLNPVKRARRVMNRERKLAALKKITGVIEGSDITLEEAREERLKRQ
jgi:hypothetical protein